MTATARNYHDTGGVDVTYVKRRSSAVCGNCDWSAVSDGTDSESMAGLKRSANCHSAFKKHRVTLTLTQDIFIEPRIKAEPVAS
jgi:hypothetical protein